MREILFRGKRTDNGEWGKGYYTRLGDKYHYILTGKLSVTKGFPEFEHFSVIPETVGQYIGLTDDHKNKIFDGDILRFTDTNLDYTWTGVIRFGNPNGGYNWGWQIVPIGDVDVNTDILLWVETELPNIKCEIIGNIHDNPELLGR